MTILDQVRRKRRGNSGFAWLLLAPASLVLAVLVLYPLVRLIIISFQSFGLSALFSGTTRWVGLGNYRAMFTGGDFVPVLVRTVVFCAVLVLLTLVIGLGMALIMTKLGKKMRLAVTISLITAWAMPTVASTLVWQWLFQPMYGVANWMITQLHVFGDYTQKDWTADSSTGFVLITMLVVWAAVPFVALTLYAALSQVPRSFYDAAEVDGGSGMTIFWKVTIPFVKPVILLLAILSIIWDFNIFNQIWIFTQGGPNGGTTTLGIWSFVNAFSRNNYGQGAAIAMVSTALLMVLTYYYVRQMTRSGEQL